MSDDRVANETVLAPCPCCGAEAQFGKIIDAMSADYGAEYAECTECGLTTDLVFAVKEDAKLKLAESWNRRAHPSAQDKADAGRQRVALKQHGGECATDESARDVCEGMYGERTDEVLGLVEALLAIKTLCGGYAEQEKRITKIIDDAIEEHAAWTR